MRGSLAGTSSSSSRSCGQSSKLESTHWWPHFAYAIRPNGVSPARPERRCSMSVGVLLLVETKLREERERGIAADPDTGRKLEGYAISTSVPSDPRSRA